MVDVCTTYNVRTYIYIYVSNVSNDKTKRIYYCTIYIFADWEEPLTNGMWHCKLWFIINYIENIFICKNIFIYK